MATTDIYTIQGALTPNRNALRCIGTGSADWVAVDAAAVAAKAWVYGTITAWVMLPDVVGQATGTILCFGDDNVVEFIQLSIEAGLLTARVTDNTTAQWVAQADAVGFTPHKFHHVAIVQDGVTPKMYIDGELIAHTNDVATDVTKWGSVLSGLDVGRIGIAMKTGDSTETEEYKGFLSEIKHWGSATLKEAALTAEEIRLEYQGIPQQAATLVNHWDFKDDYVDSGTGADNGTAVGGAILVNCANEFTSRLTFCGGLTLVTADNPRFAIHNGVGYALVTDAA